MIKKLKVLMVLVSLSLTLGLMSQGILLMQLVILKFNSQNGK